MTWVNADGRASVFWVERGFIPDADRLASFIMDELDGGWEPHRGFKGRPYLERPTWRIAEDGTKSIYSGRPQYIARRFEGCPWLNELRRVVISRVGVPFNFAYVNLYASGDAALSMHSDTEKMLEQLGSEPTIACVSFGATRRFSMVRKDNSAALTELIESGTLYVMSGRSQADWLHGCPRDPDTGPRLSITFRLHR